MRGKPIPSCIESLEDRILLSAVSWTGVGDGKSWNNAQNWNTDTVPGASDDVTINLANSQTIVYSSAAGTTAIHSLNGSDPFSITGGSLTVTGNSTLTGSFSMTGGTLTASGSGVTFTANGSTTIAVSPENVSLEADGGTLSLPQLAAVTSSDGGGQLTLGDSVNGGTIDLSSLATVDPSVDVQATAQSVGQILLSALTSLPTSSSVYAMGIGSEVDLSGITVANGLGGLISVESGATVAINSSLTTLDGTNLTLDGTGDFPISQFTSLSNGYLAFLGGSYTLPALTDVDGSVLDVENGASVSVPLLTSIAATSEYGAAIQAVGNGSVLDLPMLSSLSATFVTATNGGTIDVNSGLTSMVDGGVTLDGTGS
ncbi:MAG TPA: hypothetical protein VHX68_09975, partial [Planctomycetaceae bacterium]|nr:hypothetical protein [Planctomycetaceae bacterium]